MSVTVTLRVPFSTEAPDPIRHTLGHSTLIDAGGNLLVLDTRRPWPKGVGKEDPMTPELIQHVIASYASGEWAHAKVSTR